MFFTIASVLAIEQIYSHVKSKCWKVVLNKTIIFSQNYPSSDEPFNVVIQKLKTFSLTNYDIYTTLVFMHRSISLLEKSLCNELDKMLIINTVCSLDISLFNKKIKWINTDINFSTMSGFYICIRHKTHFRSKSAFAVMNWLELFYNISKWWILSLNGVANVVNGYPSLVNKVISLSTWAGEGTIGHYSPLSVEILSSSDC